MQGIVPTTCKAEIFQNHRRKLIKSKIVKNMPKLSSNFTRQYLH